jgi:hypothetical protein
LDCEQRYAFRKRVQKQKGPTMKKNRMLRTVLLSTVFALLTIVLMTPVASAHTAAPAHRAATATSQVLDIPNVNIVREHGKSVFSPSTIHCKAHGLSPNKPCFTITNTTDKDQQVLYNGPHGQAVATIPPGGVDEASVLHAGVGFDRLHANPQALLTVLAS